MKSICSFFLAEMADLGGINILEMRGDTVNHVRITDETWVGPDKLEHVVS